MGSRPLEPKWLYLSGRSFQTHTLAISSRANTSGTGRRRKGWVMAWASAASATATVSAVVSAAADPPPSLESRYRVSVPRTNWAGLNWGRVSSGPVGFTQSRTPVNFSTAHMALAVPTMPSRWPGSSWSCASSAKP
uniref:hypothetical protein n=1 Tax=Pigmentiphaga litoralis TaxID=516702 RepID=UPI00389A16E1